MPRGIPSAPVGSAPVKHGCDPDMPALIEDYGLIGDCKTAALVCRTGSIDWLCVPRFDSPAAFAALLGDPSHGRWLITPDCPIRSISRRYRDDSLVLETRFLTDEGEVLLVDCMDPSSRSPSICRMVTGLSGQVPMKMELIVRFDYGSVIPWVQKHERGMQAIAGPDMLTLRTDIPIENHAFRTTAEFSVSTGQQAGFQLDWYPSYGVEPLERDIATVIGSTTRWWRRWTSHNTLENTEWRDPVLRSLTVLKAMTFAPTGGLIAAPTTSLPEQIGGVRNWDYRYCWLRDATFALFALLESGFIEEAREWRHWLLRAVAGHPRQMHIVYGVRGERRINEGILDWLPGYEGSSPVRIGNGAWNQFQLDVYGEVMDMLHQARRAGVQSGETAWALQSALIEYLEGKWTEPDEGIWEVRGPRRQFTHSKVMAWVAFDRAVKAIEEFGLSGDALRWKAKREEIHAQVCREGFDLEIGAFTQYYGSKFVDASLLMVPLVGFLPVNDPRVTGTIRAIEDRLLRNGFVHRYETDHGIDGLPPGEGSFLLCSFWLADAYAMAGREQDALATYERLLSIRNDLGLLAEGYDVDRKRLVGNFPQAFSHIGLINTAANLSRMRVGPALERTR